MPGVRVKVRLIPEGKNAVVELETRRVSELLHKLGYSFDDAVVIKDGRPLLEEEELSDGDEVAVIRTASGG
jgi:sulfur carrier protein